MKRMSVLLVLAAVSIGFAPPAHAVPPTASIYSNCAKLLVRYPDGVAKSIAAAARAAKRNPPGPVVNASVYRVNSRRLDRDGNGVLCDRELSYAASHGTYVPTGLTLVDLYYMQVASDGLLDPDQAQFPSQLWDLLEQSVGPASASRWAGVCDYTADADARTSYVTKLLTDEILGVMGYAGSDAWARREGPRTFKLICESLGYPQNP